MFDDYIPEPWQGFDLNVEEEARILGLSDEEAEQELDLFRQREVR